LEVQPHLRVRVCKLAETQGHISTDATLPFDKLVYGSAMDPEPVCQLLLGQAKFFQDVCLDKFTRGYGSVLREHFKTSSRQW
jgi:hypothetical protein